MTPPEILPFCKCGPVPFTLSCSKCAIDQHLFLAVLEAGKSKIQVSAVTVGTIWVDLAASCGREVREFCDLSYQDTDLIKNCGVTLFWYGLFPQWLLSFFLLLYHMSPVAMTALTLASLLLFSSENLGEVPHTGLWGVVCHFFLPFAHI